MYEQIRPAMGQLWSLLRRFVPTTLLVVAAALVMVSCALLVYLGAVLLARFVLWLPFA